MREVLRGIGAVVIFLYIVTIVTMLLCGIVLGIGGEEEASLYAFGGALMLFFFALGYLAGKRNAEK